MRRLTTMTLSALLAVALAGGLAACGSDDDAATTTTTTTEAGVVDPEGTDTTVGDLTGPAAVEASEVAEAFMAARVAGSGAEALCTREALVTYQGAIELYDVASFEVTGLEAVDANSFEATVAITDVTGATRTETLFLGPGQLAGGTSQGMAVRGGVVDAG